MVARLNIRSLTTLREPKAVNVDQISQCPNRSHDNTELLRTMMFLHCIAVHPPFEQDEAVRILCGLIPFMAQAALFIQHAFPEEADRLKEFLAFVRMGPDFQ